LAAVTVASFVAAVGGMVAGFMMGRRSAPVTPLQDGYTQIA